MGHKISKEQIDPGVKDHIMSFVGDVTDLETEVNTDIISAVNSLMVDRVDNAENMGKLANAIGEPVTANHSVDEVVEGLGEMLSTFKTNMMNSGVVVESSDRFKSLIDKIKGLTEGEGNKGVLYTKTNITISNTPITFETHSSNYENNQNYQQFLPATVSLDFNPTVYIVILTTKKQLENGNCRYYEEFHIYDATEPFDGDIWDYCYVSYGDYTSDNEIMRDSSWSWYDYIKNNVENNMITFPIISSYEFSDGTLSAFDEVIHSVFYAIGVGEEDTTLRDSLASILEEEGVSVSEEDDMASLISKVDEEFDRKIDVKSGSYISPITMTEDIRKITITHNLGKAPSFISIYIPYTSLYYLYGGYENYLQASTTRAMNYIIDSRVYYDADHRFIVLADSNRYMHAYITDITNTSFSFAMCCGKEGSGYEIHLDSFDWVVM